MSKQYKSVLTIAGSDSGGGAGVQADIKSISANGAYAASVITATTAQNTQGILDIHTIPTSHIKTQLDAVLSDIDFGAIKIGMLPSAEIIVLVQGTLRRYGIEKVILDPVMVASSGSRLMGEDALVCLKKFLPEVYLITPNIPEAEVLIGHEISLENMEESTKEIATQFKVSVLLKGGHLAHKEMMTDILYNYETKIVTTIQNKTIQTDHTHGTGCSLASSIATFICLGDSLDEAVQKGCAYVNRAIDAGKDKTLGKGNNPINHFGL